MECYTDLLPNKYPGSNYFLESEVTSTYECHMACMESPRCQMSSLILDGGLVCRLYENRDEELEDNDNAVVFKKTCMQGKNIGSLFLFLIVCLFHHQVWLSFDAEQMTKSNKVSVEQQKHNNNNKKKNRMKNLAFHPFHRIV